MALRMVSCPLLIGAVLFPIATTNALPADEIVPQQLRTLGIIASTTYLPFSCIWL
jgi:hypothetical protein